MIVRSLPVSELRANLASVLSDVEAGQRVLLTRHDRVVAALVPPSGEGLTPLEARAAALLADIAREAPNDDLPPVVEHPSIDPKQWVAEIMADRG
jgi:prevent-host-death family protein